MLSSQGIHIVTGLKSNMKNRLTPLPDKIMLRKHSVIETINALGAYRFFEKKPAIRFERSYEKLRIALFF